MHPISLEKKIKELPEELKSEVMDFVDFLLHKRKSKIQKVENKREFGCAKGEFNMSKDFDEPLEDFKEYM